MCLSPVLDGGKKEGRKEGEKESNSRVVVQEEGLRERVVLYVFLKTGVLTPATILQRLSHPGHSLYRINSNSEWTCF